MAFLSRKELIDRVKEMSFYEEEYDIVMSLYNNLEPALFVKIIEEVVLGGISFSDFKRVFSLNEYETLLRNNLEQEKIVRTRLERYFNFKRNLFNLTENEKFKMNNIAIIESDDEELNNFYKEEVAENRKDLLYTIFDNIEESPDLVKVAKKRLLEQLEQYYENNKAGEDPVSPDDVLRRILFFVENDIIPLDVENQVLTRSDMDFMMQNNIPAEAMKKIKALSTFIRKDGKTNEQRN